MSYLLDYNPGTQQWGFPRRGGAQLSGTIIVHTAECAADNVGEDSSAENCARMIANRADWGSYHRLVDSDSIIDMLPWEYEAWQDSETNNWAVGISAALRTSDWATMPGDRRDRVYRNLAACAADFVRYMAARGVTVPLVRISGAQARSRVPGFCAHGDSGLYRSDPGTQFDWALFFRYTAEFLSGTIQPQSITIEEDFMASMNDQEKGRLLAAVDRILGRDVQRWIGPENQVSETWVEGWFPARSVDLHDVLALHQLAHDNTAKVLDAVRNIPGVDTTVIDRLGVELEARLDQSVKGLRVTLVPDMGGEK